MTRFVALESLGVVLGVYWVVAGVVALVGSAVRRDGRIERLAVGVLSLSAGVLVLVLPPVSPVVLVWLAGGELPPIR